MSELLQRDNDRVTMLLSAIAEAFNRCDSIHQADVQDLQLGLQSFRASRSWSSSRLLLDLDQQDNQFFIFLRNQMGIHTLCMNLFRLSMMESIPPMVSTMDRLGQLLLAKAKVLLNRPFWIQTAQGYRWSRGTFGNALVNLAEHTALYRQQLLTIAEHSQLLESGIRQPTQPRKLIAGYLMERLQMTAHSVDPIPFQRENNLQFMLHAALSGFLAGTEQYLQQIQRNADSELFTEISLKLRGMQGLLQHLSHNNFYCSDPLAVIEDKRLLGVEAVGDFNSNLQLIVSDLDRILIPKLRDPRPIVQNSIGEELAAYLMAEGISPSQAEQASQALLEYQYRIDVAAEAILPEELPHIHPQLSLGCLRLFQSLSKNPNLALNRNTEKGHVVTLAKKLATVFSQKNAVLSVLFCCLLNSLQGCGHKKPPKSDQPDYRPSIPFRHQESSQGETW